MRILIYGAGVLGSELAHVLSKTNHEIILLARGKWRQHIEKNGLVIRHYLQRKTTVDHLQTIDHLDKNDVYDLIFVVMQCVSLPEISTDLKANASRRIIFIGNNGEALALAQQFENKEVAFGFQGTGGRRENGQVISIYKSLSLTIGGVTKALSDDFQRQITALFEETAYHLTWENQMDAWLKSHLAFILPICYLCYSVDGKLPKATRKQRKLVLDAAYEGYQVLKVLNIPVRPAGEEVYFYKGWKKMIMTIMLWVMCKTPLGRLAASDHAMHAVREMNKLDEQFTILCQRAAVAMPNWQILKEQALQVMEK